MFNPNAENLYDLSQSTGMPTEECSAFVELPLILKSLTGKKKKVIRIYLRTFRS